jgi:hypothetical protein
MGKKSGPPPPPDYSAMAEKTAASSQEAQTRADWANRPDQITPWGAQKWDSSQMIDPATGKTVTKWTQNTTIDPKLQAALDQQQSIDAAKSQIAGEQIGRAREAMANPFDWQGMRASGQAVGAQNVDPNQFQSQGAGQGIMSGINTQGIQGPVMAGGDQGRQRTEQALMARMQPQNQQAQAALEGKLANMGLTRGSEAWKRESQNLADQQSRQAFDAMQTAGQEQQRNFGMELQARQQGFGEQAQQAQFQNAAQAQGFGQGMAQNQQNFGMMSGASQQNFQQQMAASQYQNQLRQQDIAEQQQKRAMPLNEMNALLTGAQVAMPTMPSFNTSQSAGGVNYSGAAKDQYSAGMDAYNAKQQQNQALMSGIGSVAGIAAMAM